MPCYKPLVVYRARQPNKSGKHGVVFKREDGLLGSQFQIPCSQCIGCRLERSRQWAIRCVHETQSHEFNSFITLTYSDENLPFGGTLVKNHFQKFIKRLRGKIHYDYQDETLQYFMCGEYGDYFDRPHYHACLFGWDFPDKTLWSTRDQIPLYTSELLQSLWPHGHSTTGEVNFETAAYTARYCLKKITGKTADDHYTRYCPITNASHEIEPEYATMSLHKPIGKTWFNEFNTDVYPSDEVIIRGRQMQPPIYYDRLHELHDSKAMATIKSKRRRAAQSNRSDSTPARLNVRERCKLLQAQRLLRTYEGN